MSSMAGFPCPVTPDLQLAPRPRDLALAAGLPQPAVATVPLGLSVVATPSVPGSQSAAPEDAAIWLPAVFVQDLVETAVLQHFEVIQASALVRSDTIGLVPKDALMGWEPLRKALQGLAYAPGAADAWHRLGIVPLSGPKPSEATIEQRVAVCFLRLFMVVPG